MKWGSVLSRSRMGGNNLSTFFFDYKIVEIADNENVIFYSPCNNNWVKTNSYASKLLKEVINNRGLVNVSDLRKIIGNEICEISDIESTIDKFCKAGVLFINKQSLKKSCEEFQLFYYSNNNFAPKLVYIHPTYDCNLNCWYCYNRGSRKKSEELPTIKWIEIVDILYSLGISDLVITGGEPLLRNDLSLIAKRATERDIGCTIITNGLLLNKNKILSKLIPYVDSFMISCDTIEQPKTKNLRSIEKALFMLSEICPEKVSVRTVVADDNLKQILDLNYILKNRFGIKRHYLTMFLPNNKEEIKLMPNNNALDKISKQIQVIDVEKSISSNGFVKCGACRYLIGIAPNGDIFPCQSFIGIECFKLGNIFKQDIQKTIHKQPVFQLFSVLSVDMKPVCSNCPFRYLCGGGCPAIAWKVYGNLNAYLPFLCNTMKENAIEVLKHSKTKKV